MCGVAAEEDRPVGLWPKARTLGPARQNWGSLVRAQYRPTHETPATLEVSSSLRPVETTLDLPHGHKMGSCASKSSNERRGGNAYACFPDSEPTQYRDGWLPSS